MSNEAKRPEQAHAVLGGSPVVVIRWLLRAAWRALRGADQPTYITVPVGRGLKAVMVVHPNERTRRDGQSGRHGDGTLNREQ
jgi:hypothetical protein